MFKRLLLALFLFFAVMMLSYAAPDPSPIIPGMGEFDTLAAAGAGLTTSDKNPPRSMDAGLASVTAMDPGHRIEDRDGSQFSNKVINEDNIRQLIHLNVFGANLFSNQCRSLPQIALYHPNYLISIGDKISLSIWGAFEYTTVAQVDSQGNIFIPKVGPVHVADIPNKDLNEVISAALKKTFERNVTVYANLMSAQPVQVFVSGYVAKPGLYDGMSSDSALYFLCKAGGILTQQGSFRHVDLVRNGKVISHIDLYNFLLDGVMPFSQL